MTSTEPSEQINQSTESPKTENEDDSLTTVFADPKNFNIKHPLQNRWTLFFDRPKGKSAQSNWENNLKELVTVQNVEDFWGLYKNVAKSSELMQGSNYHLFLEGVRPMWEDPYNEDGGKWVLTLPNKNRQDTLDKLWLWTLLSVIGEAYQEHGEICGCVVSIRKGQDRIALWTKTADSEEVAMSIGNQWKEQLELKGHKLQFHKHAEAMQRNSSFNNKAHWEINC